MIARRSMELRPVPEYDRFSVGASQGPQSAGGGDVTRSGGGAGGGVNGMHSTGSATGRDGGGGLGSGGSGNLSHVSTSRFGRGASRGQVGGGGGGGGLGRTSLVVRIQQGGRQLIDMGRLQADWLSNTLVKRSDAHDYINEEDQGFVALLARHVDVPAAAWQKLQDRLGGTDGHFWQSGYVPVERNSVPDHAARGSSCSDNGAGGALQEEGKAKEPSELKPRKSIFGMPVIQPYNLFAVLWTMLILLLDLTYTAFWVPMNVAFCTSVYGKLSSGCTSSDLVGGSLYFVNMLLGFQIGVVATNGIRKRTVMDGRLVSWLYIRYGKFLWDFVASVPLVYLVVVLAGQSHFRLNKGWVNCLSLLRLARMVRLVSITKVVYMDSLSGRFQDSWLARWLSVTVLYSIFLAYQLAVAINLFACIMVLCAYFEGYSNSWMTAVDWANLPTASPLYQWYCAVYWMIVTATTTGFGDFQPRSVAEQVVANVAMVGGMIMFGVLVASIGQALSRATREAHQAYSARQKILHVMEWAEHRNLPIEMRKQVQNFFADKYGRKEEDPADTVKMMAALPSRLRAKVALSICSTMLPSVHVLDALPDDVQNLLAENMRPLRLPAGEDLCQQGDVTNCFWILQEGTVQAVRYKEQPVVLQAPRLLGESVLLGEAVEAARVRPWTLRTVSPCRLWGITLGELYPLMRMYPVIGATAADYVRNKTVAAFAQAQADGERLRAVADGLANNGRDDEHWCEVSAVIVRQLLDYTPEEDAEELVRELKASEVDDGTLQPLLEQLLEFCATRRGGPAAAAAAARNQRQTSTNRRDWERPTAAAPPLNRATPAGADAGSGGGGDYAPPLSPQPYGSVPVAAGATAFGTQAAAAALTAALMVAASSGPIDPGQHQQQHPLQQHHQHYPHHSPPLHPQQQQLQLQLQQLRHSGSGPGPQPPFPSGGSGGGGGAGTSTARASAQPTVASPIHPSLPVAAAAAVQCPGCQRCICPSCGQGMDTAAPGLAAVPPPPPAAGIGGRVAAAAAASGGGAAAHVPPGAAARPGAVPPGMHAWVNVNRGTLRRQSIGLRADQQWATERRSIDRRLGAMSMMSVYE